MKDSLVDFLQELSKNPDLKAKFQADPKGVAEAQGLSAEDVKVLVDNDEEAINKRFDAKGLASEVNRHFE